MDVNYLVVKETFAYVFCPTCKGSTITKRTFQGKKFEQSCSTCKGTGKQKITHRTEISLQEALSEINKNTTS